MLKLIEGCESAGAYSFGEGEEEGEKGSRASLGLSDLVPIGLDSISEQPGFFVRSILN